MQEQKDQDEINLDEELEDIELQDSNLLLEDQEVPIVEEDTEANSKTRGQKIKEFFKDLWQNPKKRWGVIAGCAIFTITVLALPQSRYFLLNNVGVRSSASVKVLDSSTGQPLKNVTVKIHNTEVKTGEDGRAKLEHLKLGRTQLSITKRAFADTTSVITIGWGSNPLGDQQIKPVGVQYSFDVKDYLTGKPIEKAEALSDDYSAFSDEKGRLVLTIDQPKEETLKITIKAKGNRDEVIEQSVESKEVQSVTMVPARKHMFVSKRSGKYDVYKIDVDGKNEELVLSGTGVEKNSISLVSNPDKDIVALVSTRENKRNKDGFLLSTLTVINEIANEESIKAVATSEEIQIIGWAGDQLVYLLVSEGPSGSIPDRHRLASYNTQTGETKELAKSNYFNDVLMVGGDVYYVPSSALGEPEKGLFKIDSKGENKRTLFEGEIWNVFRTDFDTIMFSVKNDWYEYDLVSHKVLASAGAPANLNTKVYIDAPEKKNSLWIDQRDGKGTIIAHNQESKEDKVILSQSGLSYPIVWLSDKVVIYRINTVQEIADYAISLDGGEPKKIKDVTNASGVDKWYYY